MPLDLWMSAIEVGCFFSLLALGFLLTLEGASVFNFAIGPYAMAAGMAASWLAGQHGVPGYAAVLVGVLLAGVLSVATEVVVVRPIGRRLGGNDLPALVAVAATLFLIEQLAGTVFGRANLPGLSLVGGGSLRIGGFHAGWTQVLIVLVTLVVFAAAAWWLRRTRMGRLLRAVGDNKQAASILGLPVGRVRITAFILAGLVAGLAGLLFAPKAGVNFSSGLQWTLWGFLALVIGGTGSVWAPLLGGLLLGFVQIFTPYYFGSSSVDYAMLVVAIVFFGFRPNGLLTRRVRT